MSLFTVALCTVLTVSIVAKWSTRAQALSLGSIVSVFLLFSSPIFANFLVQSLEDARENPCWCDEHGHSLPVVVLGGGKHDYVKSDSVYDILDSSSIRRAAGAVKVAGPSAQYYLMGGGAGRFKESQLMAQVLLDLGVEKHRIVEEHYSRSTAGNARQLAALLQPTQTAEKKGGPRITLVTSSLHVPRASKAFEAQGFEVCHYATDVKYAKAALPVGLLPYVGALNKTTAAMHEYLGYFYYWLKQDM